MPVLKTSSYWQTPIKSKDLLSTNSADIISNLKAENCAVCHPNQYQFWQKSLHAKAIGDGLLGQLYAFDQDTQKDCLSCHAPRQEQMKKLLDSSKEHLSSGGIVGGVDCATCHVRKNIRHGTRDIALTPHGSVRGLSLFKESAFCKSCHQFDDTGEVVNGKPLESTYAEWQTSPQAKQGKTCQYCHMPNKEHKFNGIHDAEMTRQGLSIKVSRNNIGINLKLGNTGAGHALPTYITPRIVAKVVSSSGKVLQYINRCISLYIQASPSTPLRLQSSTLSGVEGRGFY